MTKISSPRPMALVDLRCNSIDILRTALTFALTIALSGAFLNASLTSALTCVLTQALNSKCLLNCTPVVSFEEEDPLNYAEVDQMLHGATAFHLGVRFGRDVLGA